MSIQNVLAAVGNLPAPIFSLWGQSNAAGNSYYGLGAPLPSSYVGNQDLIYTANYGFEPSPAAPFNFQPLNPATNSARILDTSVEVGAFWGQEQTLMHLIQAHFKRRVYLDKLALGNQAISCWKPYGVMYPYLQTIAADEKAYFKAKAEAIRWLPVLWIQGENDIGRPTADYQYDLTRLIAQERSMSTEKRPWIFQKLSTYQTNYTDTQRASINDAFDNICALDPNCYVLDTSSLPGVTMEPHEPGVHYSADAVLNVLAPANFKIMVDNNLL